MRHAWANDVAVPQWPGWRLLVIAASTLVLCSCRGPQQADGPRPDPFAQRRANMPPVPPDALAQGQTNMPPGVRPAAPIIVAGADGSAVRQTSFVSGAPAGPWSPPGIPQPWPKDEYLRDGGDRDFPTAVDQRWQVRGLDVEDTVAHYDTLDGRTLVEPSNRVHIYSPRFGAVRQVVGLITSEQKNRLTGVHQPLGPQGPTSTQIVSSNKQHTQAERQISARLPGIYESEQGDGVVSTTARTESTQGMFLPHEDLQIIRQGTFEAAEMAFLARGTTAAIAWEDIASVAVILDGRAAVDASQNEQVQSVFTIKEPPAQPKLRLVKVASTQFAQPGDEVLFTLRFDNIGNQPIGNVTIIDNLTTRLEYVADSAECTLDAEFFTQPNDGDSVVVRCEVTNPLKPGEGGIIRFRCRVR